MIAFYSLTYRARFLVYGVIKGKPFREISWLTMATVHFFPTDSKTQSTCTCGRPPRFKIMHPSHKACPRPTLDNNKRATDMLGEFQWFSMAFNLFCLQVWRRARSRNFECVALRSRRSFCPPSWGTICELAAVNPRSNYATCLGFTTDNNHNLADELLGNVKRSPCGKLTTKEVLSPAEHVVS